MSELSAERDAKRWANTGRRWTAQLGVWLAINFSLVAMVLSGYGTGSANRCAATTPAVDDTAAGEAPSDVVRGNPDGSAPPTTDDSAATPSLGSSAPEIVDRSVSPKPQNSDVDENPVVPSLSSTGETARIETKPMPGDVAATADQSPCPVATDSAGLAADALISEALILFNPPATRGAINYLVEGKVFSLLPGEYHRLDAGPMRCLVFHQGDDFGVSEGCLDNGAYAFGIGENGWELLQPEASVVRRLLSVCRPAPNWEEPADEWETGDSAAAAQSPQ